MRPKDTIGWKDKIDLPEFGLADVRAKIDSGANRSAIHCSHIELVKNGDAAELLFHIPLDSSHGVNTFRAASFFKKKIRSSSGHVEERFIIKTTIVLLGRKIKTTFSLTDRTEMSFPILLGRKLLKSRFIIDVEQENLSFELKKQKNENRRIIKK